MKSRTLLLLGWGLCSAAGGFSQHTHTASPAASASPLTFQTVLSENFSDPELKEYNMTSSVLTIAPGGTDSVAHRHDGELFGYVLEGSVQIGLDFRSPQTFNVGQMFYEKRNIPHTLTRNASNEASAKVLIYFLMKNGRIRYTPISADKH